MEVKTLIRSTFLLFLSQQLQVLNQFFHRICQQAPWLQVQLDNSTNSGPQSARTYSGDRWRLCLIVVDIIWYLAGLSGPLKFHVQSCSRAILGCCVCRATMPGAWSFCRPSASAKLEQWFPTWSLFANWLQEMLGWREWCLISSYFIVESFCCLTDACIAT